MDWFVSMLVVLPALYLYAVRSSWLIDYLVWVTVLNRGLRRYVDWLSGAFNPLSPVSLTPLVVSGLICLFVLRDAGKFPRYLKRIFGFFAVALAIGFVVGIVRNQLAAVYALAEYVAPLSIMGCAALAKGNEKILDRWIRSIGWAAVVASLYGWYQYYTIPPWDAFWVTSVGLGGYLGNLRPTEMTVFSTMSERGILAGFLASAVIPMVVSKRWRNPTGWISVTIILSTILLTFVRTALITVAMAVILFPLLNRGKKSFRIILLLGVVAVFGNFVVGQMPGAKKITRRLQTLGEVTKDSSFQGRILIAADGFSWLARNPIGTGLGSTGLSGRVNTGKIDAGAAIGDNGYLEVLFSFGILGGAVFFYALYLIWHQVLVFQRMGLRSESLMMFKALFVSGMVGLMAGNWLSGPGCMVFSIFAGFSVYPRAGLDRLAGFRRGETARLRSGAAEPEQGSSGVFVP